MGSSGRGLERRRLIAAGGAAALGSLAAPQPARAAPPLTVWFSVEGAKAMRRIGERFAADTGVPVVVETPDEGPMKFQQAASAGKGPDIFVYAHDRIGEWTAGGLLHAVEPQHRLWADIDPLAWRGFGYRGRLWGYPYAIEAITLIHNRRLLPEPPKTFEEVFALDARLRAEGQRADRAIRAILWDYTNNYFTWPLLAAGGGYAFRQRADDTWDATDTGVARPGALQGAALLDRMLREGLMPRGSGYPEMEAAMAQGRVAMTINGPWGWVNLQRAGVDFGTARIPSVGGQPSRPFVGIKGLMINRATRQRELAVAFIEDYLLTPEGLRAIDAAEPIGAPASRAFLAEKITDPRIAGIVDSARDGVPTPSNPEMGRFWAAMKTALTNLSEGRQSPEQALAIAARRIGQR